MLKEKNCLHCQTAFIAKGSFCSKEHQLAWDRERKNKAWEDRPEIENICENETCRKTYKTRDKRKKACSSKSDKFPIIYR